MDYKRNKPVRTKSDLDRKAIKRKNEEIRKRNRNRIIFFGILLVFAVIGFVSVIAKLPFFKSKEKPTSQAPTKVVGGDIQVTETEKAPTNDEVREAMKEIKSKEGFTDKLQKVLISLEEVDIYTRNDEKSEVIGKLPASEYINFYGSEDGWFKVQTNELKGYAKAEYFEDLNDENIFKIVDGIIIANKKFSVPEDYEPGLSPEALQSFSIMKADMERDNMNLDIVSDYRSFEEQRAIYENDLAQNGKEYVDNYSAVPGHSEHQLGLAIDVTNDGSASVNNDFADTKEAEWISKNAHKYGFILRYPRGKKQVTGYEYEPWHLRYLGPDLAKKIYDSGLTLEEYYDL